MNRNVTIIDYGHGNILSVQRGFEYFGANVTISNNTNLIENSDRVVLPGVGAFGSAMKELKKLNLIESIYTVVKKEIPLLGICLGMQLLFEESKELGIHNGLAILPGSIEKIPEKNQSFEKTKLPHIGWTKIERANNKKWENTILEDIKEKDAMYFIHSYMLSKNDRDIVIATCQYNEIIIPSVVQLGKVSGCQFHPEKSGKLGLKILCKFLEQN